MVVLHQAFVNAGAKVGKNVILNTATNIEHDAVIGDQCHISTGTMVNDECKVGERCFIGSQSVLANYITVGDDIIVGAGSIGSSFIKAMLRFEPFSLVVVDLNENGLAAYTGAKCVVVCVSGTNALHMSLLLTGVEEGTYFSSVKGI